MSDASLLGSGFHKLSLSQRLNKLATQTHLSKEDCATLANSSPEALLAVCDQLSENVIGTLNLPLGLLTQVKLDGQQTIIPMATEETSVLAAANNAAKWVNTSGHLNANIQSAVICGQIHLHAITDFHALKQMIETRTHDWISLLNSDITASLAARGGGVTNLRLRDLGDAHASLDVFLDPVDAMGANQVTQACEALRQKLTEHCPCKTGMAIVSNLADQSLVHATIQLNDVDPKLGEAIANASLFAQKDPYRAATHNKGIMNGVDAVLIATGNDARAVEAGAHAYATRDGQYRGLSTWQYQDGQLYGELTMPCTVGIVGGATRSHPIAALSLKLMQINTSEDLACRCVAVGLLQNLAALRALVSEGIVSGHMRLHIDNLMLACNVQDHVKLTLRKALEQRLQSQGKLSESDVKTCLKGLKL